MINHKKYVLNKALAVGLACVFAGAGVGATPEAQAARVVGYDSVPNGSDVVDTSSLTIQLTQGNPDDDGESIHGKVEGVTIQLERLKGIDANDDADMKRVADSSFEELKEWESDLKFTGVTTSEGVVTFDNLENGIYVVTSLAPSAEYREVNPFLVAVPFRTVNSDLAPVPGVIVAKTHTPGKTPPPVPTTSFPTPPVAPPTTTPPSTPSRTTPVQNDEVLESQAAEEQGSQTRSEGVLAMTGAQVIGLIMAAATLIAAGFALMVMGRRKNDESSKK